MTFDNRNSEMADAQLMRLFDQLGQSCLQLRDSAAAESINQQLETRGMALEQVLLDRYIRLNQ